MSKTCCHTCAPDDSFGRLFLPRTLYLMARRERLTLVSDRRREIKITSLGGSRGIGTVARRGAYLLVAFNRRNFFRRPHSLHRIRMESLGRSAAIKPSRFNSCLFALPREPPESRPSCCCRRPPTLTERQMFAGIARANGIPPRERERLAWRFFCRSIPRWRIGYSRERIRASSRGSIGDRSER